jgi:MinD superfamily P-loop ATPase
VIGTPSGGEPAATISRPFVLAVASGKGGTGKTLVATNLAAEAASRGLRVVLVDCDADAPNDHLFLPRSNERVEEIEAPVADVDASACTACGACSSACAFGAVRVLGRTALVFEELCHGCGLCVRVCPERAIVMRGARVGTVVEGRIERYPDLHLVSGVLDIGQVKAPDVIRAAVERGMSIGGDLIVLDAPPGVACPVVAAVRGADAMLLVTEPTAFGMHDLALAVELGRELGVPMAMVANKVTAEAKHALEEPARTLDVALLASIPFDRHVAEVYAAGDLLIEKSGSSARWLDPVLAWIGDAAHRQPHLEKVTT